MGMWAAFVLPHPHLGNPSANRGCDSLRDRQPGSSRAGKGSQERCTIPVTFLLPNPSHLPKVVANLFFGHAQVVARQRSLIRRSSTRTRRYKAPTVAARFQQSLLDLVEKMERSGQAGWAEQAGQADRPCSGLVGAG